LTAINGGIIRLIGEIGWQKKRVIGWQIENGQRIKLITLIF
jgi:hypothetical protein